jgi:hypothetical protein
MEGKACGQDEALIYTTLRHFDEASLLLPQGSSLIGQLTKAAGTVLIEDADLTASRIRKHLKAFGLDHLRVTDLSAYRGRRGASVAFITKRPSPINPVAS